jgi:hypothetical protein
MQYKQVRRILTEIISDAQAPTKIVLGASQLLLEHDTLPKLGPYRKRSATVNCCGVPQATRIGVPGTDGPRCRSS